jgi:geranylgeranyl diphosphate synthase, type II
MNFNYSQMIPDTQARLELSSLAPDFEDVDNFQPVSNLSDFFNDVRILVDSTLDELVPSNDIGPTRLYQAIRWSLFGEGKRFRPALVIAVGRCFGASDEKLVRTAAGVEMIHTYSLIHDDLPAMDDDDLRRGRATAHKKFDEATAILAGDALQAMAFEAIAGDESLNEGLRLRLVGELSVAAGQMVAGQQLDLEAEGKSVDIDSIEKIHKGKTGALIGFAVRAGGMIASADDDGMGILRAFGDKLGLLFQITDDILDVTSTSAKLGKTAGKDLASKKATYPEVLGLERARKLAKNIEVDAVTVLGELRVKHALLTEICSYVSDRTS